MQSHVTKLELENEQLKSELEEIKSKLSDTRVELEKVIKQSERDYDKRCKEFEKEQSKLRLTITSEVTQQLERTCDTKVKAAQEAAMLAKKQIIEDYDAKIKHLEMEKKEWRTRFDKVTAQQEKLSEQKAKSSKEVIHNLKEQINKCQQENEELRAVRGSDKTKPKFKPEFIEKDITNDNLANVRELPESSLRLLEQKRQLENELQVKIHHLQREKDSLHYELESLRDELAMERDKYDNLLQDYDRVQCERRELKENIDTVRECSENHIRSLEMDLANLQTKTTAMENLNDYLSNLSMSEDGMMLQNDEKYEAENHNPHDVSRDSLRSLPADLRHLAASHGGGRRVGLHDSFSSADHTYAEITSPLNKSHRPEKIHYVKNGCGSVHKDKARAEPVVKTPGLLDKLKNYVKPQKDLVDGESKLRKGKDSTSRSRHSPPEGTMRERPVFDRNSRHRHTIQNIQLKETSQPYKTAKLKSPVVVAHSQPVAYPLSRDHALRKTMPERRTRYRFPEKRSMSSRDGSQQSLMLSESQMGFSSRDNIGDAALGHTVSVDDVAMPPNPYHAHCEHRDCCTSDSGLAQSTGNSPPDGSLAAEAGEHPQLRNKHKLTSIEIINTESVRRRLPGSNTSLVQQMMKLQDQNVNLSSQNAELKKSVDSLKFADVNDASVAQKLLKLEAENKKLKMIIETLQYTISGKNPFDKTEYHYFSNV